MKLCKACNGTMPKDCEHWTYCDREVCRKARKAVTKQRYQKIEHPYSHYDERTNWICKCTEQWLVPAKFNYCQKCGAIPRRKFAMKHRVFIPKKHGVDINSFIQSYFERLENGLVKPS